MKQSDINELQQLIFNEVANYLNRKQKWPLKVTLGPMNESSKNDIEELKDKQLIAWDLPFKADPLFTPITNVDHIITCIAYYGNAEKGYCCVGYALGSINTKEQMIEINFVEKRKDEFSELKRTFLPLMIEAFTAYAIALNDSFSFNINKFALIGPVEGVKSYYKELGFSIVEHNTTGESAMIKELVN